MHSDVNAILVGYQGMLDLYQVLGYLSKPEVQEQKLTAENAAAQLRSFAREHNALFKAGRLAPPTKPPKQD